MNRHPVRVVVAQHAEDAVLLRNTRTHLVRAPHVRLHQLARLDERMAGHLDGLAVAGEVGARMATEAMERPGSAEVFVVAVCAIERRDPVGLERLFAMVEAVPESRPGLFSTVGWVSATSLQGITRALLASSGVLQREVGLAACAMHGVDPQAALDAAFADEHAALRARSQGWFRGAEYVRRERTTLCRLSPSHKTAAARRFFPTASDAQAERSPLWLPAF